MRDFERNMDLLAGTESQGRWIVTPRKGTTFMGPHARAQVRARERRRRVLTALVEALVATALIGLVPPLRAVWYATAFVLMLLGAYVWVLLAMKARADHARSPARPFAEAEPVASAPARQRFAAEGSSRTARPAFNGLAALVDDPVDIVVRPAAEADAAPV